MSTDKLMKLLAPVMKLDNLGIPTGLIQDIIFRLLFNESDVSIARFAEVLGIHPSLVDELLARMKQEHLVEVKRAGGLGSLSFIYGLTEAGTKRARDAFERSQYVGRVPISLEKYTEAILLQSKREARITPTQMKQALGFLILPENFDRRLGPAVNAGTSLFLYGPPGNGKTTIAQAIAKLIGRDSPIWLPDAITVGGQIIRVFDPLVHTPIEEKEMIVHAADFANGRSDKLKFDHRWRLFERPAVMVGGELTMDSLDLRYEPIAKVYEAPLQLKANGGMFLIDDFGRQQISPQELLNRWIVPLESGIDFLRLQSGQSLEVPFRQLIVFSTNLDPMQLVDGAFLRRIQMKVEVGGPSEKLFYQIFVESCKSFNVPFDKKAFVHLLQKWYRAPNRVMQAVHPRDIVKTVISICNYDNTAPRLTPDLVDEACESYFVDGNMAATLADQ
ncbi:AAA family ATPase [Candidatus Leptofilum sp.]|uniref:AAA family ATPase n=1 Tax=Candidatus Leptofilum sp. TaxID=3241576 RepID=UPI003B5BC706